MKILKMLGDIAVTVGCCVGVGLLSGKETQVFFCSDADILLFAAVFAAANIAVRSFCLKRSCNNVTSLSASCFKKFSPVMSAALIFCSFVCLVTALAGVEQCLSQLFYVGKIPLYSVCCAALGAAILLKGMKALKIANAVSFLFAAAFFVIAFQNKSGSDVPPNDSDVLLPISYAVFSVTMSLGVTSKLAQENTEKENAACCVISAVILAAIIFAVRNAGDYSLELPMLAGLNGFEKAIAATALMLAAVTGIVANANPVSEELSDVIPDDNLRCAFIFTAAIAFSMFGFDVAVKYGYIAVSVIGMALLAPVTADAFARAAAFCKKTKNKRREAKNPRGEKF